MVCSLVLQAVDADIIKDAGRFKMDLVGGLEKALHGKVKPSMSSPLVPYLTKLSLG